MSQLRASCYLQSTVKPPAVWNFTRITLPFVYGIGVGGYTIIMYVGEFHVQSQRGTASPEYKNHFSSSSYHRNIRGSYQAMGCQQSGVFQVMHLILRFTSHGKSFCWGPLLSRRLWH